jgi:hypothetical protein
MQLDREFDHRDTMCSGLGVLRRVCTKWVFGLGHWFSSKENNLKTRFDVLIVGHRIIQRGGSSTQRARPASDGGCKGWNVGRSHGKLPLLNLKTFVLLMNTP